MRYLKSFRGINVDLQISYVNGKTTLSKLRKYEQDHKGQQWDGG